MVEKNIEKGNLLKIDEFVNASMGLIPYDLIVMNVNIVNVLINEIYKSDIGIINGYIVSISTSLKDKKAKTRFDGTGKYVVPGYIDSHMHLESSMLKPSEFAKEIILSLIHI